MLNLHKSNQNRRINNLSIRHLFKSILLSPNPLKSTRGNQYFFVKNDRFYNITQYKCFHLTLFHVIPGYVNISSYNMYPVGTNHRPDSDQLDPVTPWRKGEARPELPHQQTQQGHKQHGDCHTGGRQQEVVGECEVVRARHAGLVGHWTPHWTPITETMGTEHLTPKHQVVWCSQTFTKPRNYISFNFNNLVSITEQFSPIWSWEKHTFVYL